MKQAVIRQVKSMTMSCDPIGNLLLTKFSYVGAKDSCVFIPANIVFWLLKHFPVNQDPTLRPPPGNPTIYQDDWENPDVPRALSVECKQFSDSIRMNFQLDRAGDLVVLLDRSNVELMRQIMLAYRPNLIDLDA